MSNGRFHLPLEICFFRTVYSRVRLFPERLPGSSLQEAERPQLCLLSMLPIKKGIYIPNELTGSNQAL